MLAIAIGVSLGLFVIGLFLLLKEINKQIMYGLILASIGFLYVGFCWTNLRLFIVCSLQAVVFLFLAYYGSKKSMLILATGYILHGIWDLAFEQVYSTELLPPHYNLFCLAIDFTMGIYLFYLYFQRQRSSSW